jgi:hypothetical protein
MIRHHRSALIATVIASGALLLAGSPASLAAGPHSAGGPQLAAGQAPGTWTKLGLSQTAPPVLWRAPDDQTWLVWSSNKNGTYELAKIAPAGTVAAKPRPIITDWSGVTSDPTLLAHGSVPLLVFSGQDSTDPPLEQGCVVGALPASGLWTVQSWSLSSNCVFSNVGYGDAAENSKGTLSAAWSGGKGVEYRIGASGSIPAKGPDGQISLSAAHASAVAEADDAAGNGDTYVAFYRFFSVKPSSDGVYVKDLTAGGPVIKAPLSGTESVSYPAVPQRVALASVSRPGGGVYLAYCSNAGTCNTFLLWKAGAKKAITVPHTKLAIGLAMSAGPAGRLWLAWYDEQDNRVYTVRTNKADTRFGALASFPAPCFADGNTHLALTSGSFSRVEVGLECLSAGATTVPTIYVTQSQAGLTITANHAKITNKHPVKVTFTVTDAGDRVAGAKVELRGTVRHTGSNGTVTFTFAKGLAPGGYKASASAASYFGASTTVKVVR